MTTTPREVITSQNGVSPEEAQGVYGEKGLSAWGGLVGEEYLQALKPWSREVRVYLEMRDDVTIGTLLDALKLPLLAAEFSVPPLSDSPPDEAAAEFLLANLHGMHRQTWRSFVSDSLEFLDFGWAVNEIVLEKREDGRLWLRNIDPRGQETLNRWELDENDTPTHMVQGQFRTGGPTDWRYIPLDKCVHVAWRGRKGNPQGKALLRSLYRPWRFLKNLEQFEGIGVERDIGGMPIFKLPAEPLTDGAIDDLKSAAKGLRRDEELYLLLPHDTEVSAYVGGVMRYDIRRIIDAKRKEILMRMFAQFLELGMDKVGTQALVEGSQDFFTLGLTAIQSSLLESYNQQLVEFLFRFNTFEGMTDLPKIHWSKPGNPDIEGWLKAFDIGVKASVITPIRPDEEKARQIMGLPDLPEDMGNEPRRPVPSGLPPFAMSEHHDGIWRDWLTFADPRIRPGSDRVTRHANKYQRELVRVYDKWAVETARLAALPGRTAVAVSEMVSARLRDLEVELTLLGRQRISQASGLGLGKAFGKRASSPAVLATTARLIADNDRYIATSLMPGLRARFIDALPDNLDITDIGLRKKAMQAAVAVPRARVASYAGGAVVAAFDTQRAAGQEENAERVTEGERPIATRWVLDPSADNCEDDPARGTMGCISLQGEYVNGWDSMPTVPAGNTSCLGNCRCYIEFDMHDGKGWRRFD